MMRSLSLADTLLLAALIIVGFLGLLHRLDPPQQLPLVKADYSRCVTVQTGELKPQRGVRLYPQRRNEA